MNDKEKLDMLLEAVDIYIKSTGQDTAIAIKAMIDASKACREPEKPRVLKIAKDHEGSMFVMPIDDVNGDMYVLYDDAVRRRLGKDAGVDRGLVKEVMNNTPVGAIEGRTERIMQIIAAAAVEVDDS